MDDIGNTFSVVITLPNSILHKINKVRSLKIHDIHSGAIEILDKHEIALLDIYEANILIQTHEKNLNFTIERGIVDVNMPQVHIIISKCTAGI
jgi:F0F1-type ATP synthase epsilon subunit